MSVGLMMPVTDVPHQLSHGARDKWVERGGSCIIAPDSTYIVEPVFDRDELIIADLDLAMIGRESMSLDVTGHYARPDVFRFSHSEISPSD
jgi:predicted amidohydrolase